jgi:hypothetical protein
MEKMLFLREIVKMSLGLPPLVFLALFARLKSPEGRKTRLIDWAFDKTPVSADESFAGRSLSVRRRRNLKFFRIFRIPKNLFISLSPTVILLPVFASLWRNSSQVVCPFFLSGPK